MIHAMAFVYWYHIILVLNELKPILDTHFNKREINVAKIMYVYVYFRNIKGPT